MARVKDHIGQLILVAITQRDGQLDRRAFQAASQRFEYGLRQLREIELFSHLHLELRVGFDLPPISPEVGDGIAVTDLETRPAVLESQVVHSPLADVVPDAGPGRSRAWRSIGGAPGCVSGP